MLASVFEVAFGVQGYMTSSESRTSSKEISARRWFRGTIGTAVGLSVLVNLISLLVPPNFVRGTADDLVYLPLWVGSIFAAHLLLSYPAVKFLQKK